VPTKPGNSDNGANAKKGDVVRIEYFYLDASVCERCKSTASVLDAALMDLKPVLEGMGKSVRLEKIHIRSEEDAKKYKFMSSPTVRINGQDAVEKVEENECGDCGCICDGKVHCRTWSWQNKTYEVPPKGLIIDAVLRAVYTKPAANSGQYALPENLKSFFAGVKSKTTEVCAVANINFPYRTPYL